MYRQGKRWIAMIELPRSGDGKRRRGFRRASTEAAAKRALKQMLDEVRHSGGLTDPRRTISQAIETFESGRAESPNDDWMLGLIRTALGATKVTRLTVADCDRFLGDCAAGEYGRRKIGKAHLARIRQRLSGVLRNEIRLGTVQRNVAEVAVLPAVEVPLRERRSATTEELARLLKAAEGPVEILVELCARNGLRPAEARALRWVDVDVERGLVSISGQMDRRNVRGPVKRAANAERTLQVDRATVERLARWQAEVACQRYEARNAWVDTGIVAVTATGDPVTREQFARQMKKLCEAAGVEPPVTPYELRHSAISHQADVGHTSWEIADWAGTSEAMISSTYRHQLRKVSPLRSIGLDPNAS